MKIDGEEGGRLERSLDCFEPEKKKR